VPTSEKGDTPCTLSSLGSRSTTESLPRVICASRWYRGYHRPPGFVAGHWTYKDGTGLAMVVFESEEAANGMSERVPSMLPDGVTLEDIEVREVVAHA